MSKKQTTALARALRSKIGRVCYFTHPETGRVVQGTYGRGRHVTALTGMSQMTETDDGGRGFNLDETVYKVPRHIAITFGQAPTQSSKTTRTVKKRNEFEGFSIDVIFDRYVGHKSGVGTAERVNILKSYYGGFQTEAEAQRVYDDVCNRIRTRRTNANVLPALREATEYIENNVSRGGEVSDLLIRLRHALVKAEGEE